jgi:hypothetical protein
MARIFKAPNNRETTLFESVQFNILQDLMQCLYTFPVIYKSIT